MSRIMVWQGGGVLELVNAEGGGVSGEASKFTFLSLNAGHSHMVEPLDLKSGS